MVDFVSVLKQLDPIINDVVFVEDSHSWRKDLLLQQEYKGNRKKNQDNINKLNAELYNTKHSRTPYGFLRNVIYSNKVGQTKDLDNRYNQLLDDYVDKKLF